MTFKRREGKMQETHELSATGLLTFLNSNREPCVGYLQTYFGKFEPRYDGQVKVSDARARTVGYNGAFFERYSALADPNIFDANDMAAVSCLSIKITGDIASSLKYLENDFKEMIAEIPSHGATIWEVPKNVFAREMPLWKIYDKLLELNGIASVTASKLLASKRPHLVPIRDSDVSKLFGKKETDTWWDPWWETMQSQEVRDLLTEFAKEAKIEGKSLLRIADVILWKRAQAIKAEGDLN